VVKEFWRKAASHIMPLLTAAWSLLQRIRRRSDSQCSSKDQTTPNVSLHKRCYRPTPCNTVSRGQHTLRGAGVPPFRLCSSLVRSRNNLNEPLNPFPFCVAAEQKGGHGWGWYIVGLPSLCRDSSPPLTFYLWYSHICAERGR